jgi:predicted nucleic acid-binding protein
MSADCFLDTNVLVYAFDRSDETKRGRALSLCQAEQPWQISWQVVQEFCAVALHRFKVPLDARFLSEYLEVILLPHCRIMPTERLYLSALRIQRETQYRFYDSLIVAAALESGAVVLYSEDLQHGRRIGDLRIVNPFR